VAATDAGQILTAANPSVGAVWTAANVDIPSRCGGAVVCEIEQIYASDDHGTRLLDSIRLPGTGNALANLRLSGDQLTWTDGGVLRSVTLG
jgi:hypothetical protein